MDNSKRRILIADDQPDVLIALRLLLKGEGYETESANSPAGILAALETRDFDAVLMDLNYARDTTSGQEGLDLLCRIQALDSTLPVVVMTAWGSVQLAVEAMRRGARDFIQKPWENRAAADHPADSGRTGAGAAAGAAAGGGEPAAAVGGAADADRAGALDAARARHDRAHRPVGRQRADHGRERHGQGRGCAGAARGVRARTAAADYGEHRRAVGRRVRERTVRPRQGRVHGRARRPRGALRTGRRAARCSWTRSPTSRRRSRPSCCGCSRRASSSESGRPERTGWMCGLFRRRIPTWGARFRRGGSAKTCCSG